MTAMADSTLLLQGANLNSGSQLFTFETDRDEFIKIVATDGRCVDLDPTYFVPRLAECGNYSGQYWKLIATSQEYVFQMKTMFTGEEYCLAVIPGGNEDLQMEACDNSNEQLWRMIKLQ
jgi:hypothetical protein